MGADDRAVQAEGRLEPDTTASVIAGLNEMLTLTEAAEADDHDPLVAMTVRAQLVTALAVEHVAVELALTRALLEQVAERLKRGGGR